MVGDSVSGQRAEDFRLFRHRTRQFSAFLEQRELVKRYDPTKDVLWVPTDSLDYIDGNGVDLFGAKTQGYPYHLAILFEAQDEEHYLRGIADASTRNGFALQEAAWKAIDGEENIEILKGLFALSLVDNREMQ
uniref:Uncharacterized protein n=1 Tax=Candidatus Kentrum sp. FW TaxID=2126338 RepID=A0A450TX37_9GAMM|nr:MAG: hypothetical protein BECKFW1821C_GA0114237_105430 [Candidatus Kentron sp. FW]